MKREYKFGNARIPYELVESPNRKTVSIAVDPGGAVSIRIPSGLSKCRLEVILRRKAPWILCRRTELLSLGLPYVHDFVSGESFPYWGRNYRLKLIRGARAHAALRGKRIGVAAPVGKGRREQVRKAIRLWYARRAARRLPARAAIWASKLGIPAPPVKIRDQCKRWGSCDSHGRLLLNWRIVMAPVSLIDYIVAHEVCHLVRHAHGPEFWRLLERLLPDWKERRARLLREGSRWSI